MRAHWPQYLDSSLSVSEQDPRKWKLFCNKVCNSLLDSLGRYNANNLAFQWSKICQEWPVLGQYIDHWPIKFYIASYLSTLRSRQRQGGRGHISVPRRADTSDPLVVNNGESSHGMDTSSRCLSNSTSCSRNPWTVPSATQQNSMKVSGT